MSEQKDNQQQETDIIYSYTRSQAIADGVLVDIEKEFSGLSTQAGFKFPIALTARAFSRYVQLNPFAEKALEDPKGRLWDVLWMLKVRILILKLSNEKLDTIKFSFVCTVPKESDPFGIETWPPSEEEDEDAFLEDVAAQLEQSKKLCWLKAIFGPDDEGNSCITIMLPWED